MNDKITAIGLAEFVREAREKHVAKSHELADIALCKFKQLIEDNISEPFYLAFKFLAIPIMEIDFENGTIDVLEELHYYNDFHDLVNGLDDECTLEALGMNEQNLEPFYEYLIQLGFDFAYDERDNQYFIILTV